MNNIKIRPFKDGKFEIDELAGLVPMATSEEQVALTKDIRDSGLRMPITLWRCRVVDGRCRQKALLLLKQPIQYIELDDALNEDEVAIYVKSVNTRRNLTLSQKAIIAAREKDESKKSIKDIAESWGISKGMLDMARYLHTNHKFIAESLFNGNKIQISDSKGSNLATSAISAIYKHLKREDEQVTVVESNTPDFDDKHYVERVNTEIGKDFFMEELRKLSVGATDIRDILIDYANTKFKV